MARHWFDSVGRDILAVDCPQCGAKQGRACITKTQKETCLPHAKRFDIARYQNLEHAMTLIRNGAMAHSPLEKMLVEEIDRLRAAAAAPKRHDTWWGDPASKPVHQ